MIKPQITMPIRLLPAVSAIALALFYIGAFMACSHGGGDPSPERQDSATGRIYIRIAKEGQQRAVYPDIDGFAKFTLTCTSEDGKSAPDVVLEQETSAEITLEPGDWNITVTGWTHAANSELVAAAYGSAKASVIAGETTAVEILLDKPLIEEDMEGMFEWSIRFPDLVETAEMTISALGDDGTFSIPIDTLDIREESEGDMGLPSGYYRVDVTLSTAYGEIGRSELVCIYSGLTTVLPDMEFTADDFPEPSESEYSTLEIGIGMKEGDAMDIQGLPDEPVILSRTGAMGFPGAVSLMAKGFTWIECLLDGRQVASATSGAGGNTEKTFSIDSRELTDGRHFLSVIGMKNGAPQGREIIVTVISQDEMHSVESLAELVAALPLNTQEKPYAIKIHGVNLSSASKSGNTLKTLYDALGALKRYVALDLSGCEGGNFPNIPSGATGKQYITSIILPPSITAIDTNAFQGCAALVSMKMPGVLTIKQGAFKGCENLESISLPEATEIINTTKNSYGAFYKCVKLTSVHAPKLKAIGHRSFYNCTSLATISLPSVTQIDEYAFRGCVKLVNVDMPQSVVIADNAFTGSGFVRSGV